MGANVALAANANGALTCQLPQTLATTMYIHVHQQEWSSEDEDPESDGNYSEDSDACSTNSERYDTEIITDNDYLLYEASNTD